jgi:hypothetical protein
MMIKHTEMMRTENMIDDLRDMRPISLLELSNDGRNARRDELPRASEKLDTLVKQWRKPVLLDVDIAITLGIASVVGPGIIIITYECLCTVVTPVSSV